MEKKVEDVLEILQKIFDCADLEGRYLTEKQWDILNDTANIKEYLRKELDKARREEYIKIRRAIENMEIGEGKDESYDGACLDHHIRIQRLLDKLKQ